MKKIKLLASLSAVAIASTMLATASFATEYTVGTSYTAGTDGGADTITLSSGLDNYTADNSVGEYTIVILNEDATSVTDDNLVYVMQGTKDDIKTAKLTGLTAGATYYVRVGGNSTGFVSGKVTIPGGTSTEKVLVGDADGSGSITTDDCSEMFKFIGGVTNNKISGVKKNLYAAAYADGKSGLTTDDCSAVYKRIGGVTTSGVDTIVDTEVEIGAYGEVTE